MKVVYRLNVICAPREANCLRVIILLCCIMNQVDDINDVDDEFDVPNSDYIDPCTVTIDNPSQYKYKVFQANIQSLPAKLTAYFIARTK